jgi:hypothetical protein
MHSPAIAASLFLLLVVIVGFVASRQVEPFPKLAFSIPGADVRVAGQYRFRQEVLDFSGEARIQARVSQMMKTGWKRWALKPVDPFFSKQGYGTVAQFTITGTRDQPKFSRQ